MRGLSFRELMQAIGYRIGTHDVACPICGPYRRAPVNRTRKVMRVWNVSPGFISYTCARCGESGYVRDRDALPVSAPTPMPACDSVTLALMGAHYRGRSASCRRAATIRQR